MLRDRQVENKQGEMAEVSAFLQSEAFVASGAAVMKATLPSGSGNVPPLPTDILLIGQTFIL